MKQANDKEQRAKDRDMHARHHYRQARRLKRHAGGPAQSVPHAIIERSAR